MSLKKMFFYWELFCRLVLKTMSGRKNLWWNRLWHLVSRGHCNVWVCPSQLLLVWWFSNVSILTMMIMLQHKCNPEIPIGFYYPSICNQSSSAKSRLGQENQNQNTESCIKICLWAVRRPKAENDDPRPFSWLKIEKEVSKEILWSNNFFIKLWSSYFYPHLRLPQLFAPRQSCSLS